MLRTTTYKTGKKEDANNSVIPPLPQPLCCHTMMLPPHCYYSPSGTSCSTSPLHNHVYPHHHICHCCAPPPLPSCGTHFIAVLCPVIVIWTKSLLLAAVALPNLRAFFYSCVHTLPILFPRIPLELYSSTRTRKSKRQRAQAKGQDIK